MEQGISQLYEQRGVQGLRPRFAYPLIRLAHTGPLTIKALAESLELTHSAVSQTVSALRAEGLVETVPGDDARTRVIELTDRGRDLVPFLEDEWRATEAAAAVLAHAWAAGVARVLAVTHPDNHPSQAVARRIGLQGRGRTHDYYDTESELFGLDAPARG